MTWKESKRPVVTQKGVEQKAPIHRQVKLTQSTLSHPIPAPRPKEIQEFLDNPNPFLTKFGQLYSTIKHIPKWQSREDYIKLIIKQTAERNIKDRDIRNFLDYIKEAEEDSKEKPPGSVYDDIITKIREAKTLKEVGEINQNATKSEMHYDTLKSKTDMILLSIADFTTKAQIDAFSGQLKKLTDAIGHTNDPKVIELIDNITKLYNEKRRRIYGDTIIKIRTPEEYEISNLKYEAEHKPQEMLPPKEYEDISKYTWGLTEPEAIKKYVDKELKKNQFNIEYVAKQKAELDEIVKSKPHVLLTKAQIQKQYPKDAEQMIRDLWTYKTKKSDYEKNTDSARFWQSKVDKINSGEWQKINTNYLREQYQKEVKEAIKSGKPVPYDVIKQYPEFVTSQDNRERYNRGKHTSFANVSIAVDESKRVSHGYKIKLQNGKAMTDEKADEIIKAMSQTQSAIGDISDIMRRENVTISHTSGTHPFLSTYAGVYHPTDKTITMGFQGVTAHETWHMVDEVGKNRHKEMPMYDFDLMAIAKRTMNGGTENYISLSKSKSPEDLKRAREFRFHIGAYHNRIEEIQARLIEEFVAFKHKSVSPKEYALTTPVFEELTKLPSYWSEDVFMNLLPSIEKEIARKIDMARN